MRDSYDCKAKVSCTRLALCHFLGFGIGPFWPCSSRRLHLNSVIYDWESNSIHFAPYIFIDTHQKSFAFSFKLTSVPTGLSEENSFVLVRLGAEQASTITWTNSNPLHWLLKIMYSSAMQRYWNGGCGCHRHNNIEYRKKKYRHKYVPVFALRHIGVVFLADVVLTLTNSWNMQSSVQYIYDE